MAVAFKINSFVMFSSRAMIFNDQEQMRATYGMQVYI